MSITLPADERPLLRASDAVPELRSRGGWVVGVWQCAYRRERTVSGDSRERRFDSVGPAVRHAPVPPGGQAGHGWLLVIMLFSTLILGGCGSGSDGPWLVVRSVSNRQMPALGAKFPAPRGMHFGDNGRLYVLDNAGRLLVLSPEGPVENQWMMPEYSVGRPEGIRLLRDGRIGVADTHYHRVVFFDEHGTVTSMHGREGSGPGEFVYPVCITEGRNGEYYVGEYGASGDRIQKFAADGRWLLQFGGFGMADGLFQRPSGIAWHDGQVYVADAINNRIQQFTEDGEFVRILGAPDALPNLHYPYDLALGPDNDLFVIEYSGRLTRLDLTGRVLGRFGSPGRGAGQFFTPWGLAVAPDGRIAVADTGNRRIVELTR